MIEDKFKGKVPRNMSDLITLPGVARKTANIVLYHGFGIIEGIAVDTHGKRLSERLGFTKNQDPVKIEADLMRIVPKNDWGKMSDLLIEHGRQICHARPRMRDMSLKRTVALRTVSSDTNMGGSVE
jgi:endonuclease-3